MICSTVDFILPKTSSIRLFAVSRVGWETVNSRAVSCFTPFAGGRVSGALGAIAVDDISFILNTLIPTPGCANGDWGMRNLSFFRRKRFVFPDPIVSSPISNFAEFFTPSFGTSRPIFPADKRICSQYQGRGQSTEAFPSNHPRQYHHAQIHPCRRHARTNRACNNNTNFSMRFNPVPPSGDPTSDSTSRGKRASTAVIGPVTWANRFRQNLPGEN